MIFQRKIWKTPHAFPIPNSKFLILMPPKHFYDVIVIGSGAAGFSAVESARALGASVCLVEENRLGGECPNNACIPSKALLCSAQKYRSVLDAKRFGVTVGQVGIQAEDVLKYRNEVVKTITGGGERGERYERLLHAQKVSVRFGKAHFEDEHTISVGEETLFAKSFVIATGAIPFVPPIAGLDTIHYLQSKDVLAKFKPYKSLAVIGAGAVGCEIAVLYATFGTRVVLIEQAAQVLPHEDEELAHLAETRLREMGIDVVTQASISEIVNGHGVYGIKTNVKGMSNMYAVEHFVLAAGMQANSFGFGLEELQMKFNTNGFVFTSKDQCTNISHIFAAGDVCGKWMFTHTAHAEGVVAGFNAARLALKKRSPKKIMDERVVARVTFVDPEFASVGMTEAEATAKFKKVLVGYCEISSLGRALVEHAQTGMVKLIVHPKTRRLLGGHIFGSHAGEMIHEVALAISLHARVDALANMIHAYPTFSEAIKVAAGRV